jgi:hypothetical protein
MLVLVFESDAHAVEEGRGGAIRGHGVAVAAVVGVVVVMEVRAAAVVSTWRALHDDGLCAVAVVVLLILTTATAGDAARGEAEAAAVAIATIATFSPAASSASATAAVAHPSLAGSRV